MLVAAVVVRTHPIWAAWRNTNWRCTGQRVLAVRHDPGEVDLYPVGATVYAEWVRENIYLLPEE